MSLMVYLQLVQRRGGIIFSACWGPNNEYLDLHWVGMVTRRDVALISLVVSSKALCLCTVDFWVTMVLITTR